MSLLACAGLVVVWRRLHARVADEELDRVLASEDVFRDQDVFRDEHDAR